MQNYSAVRCLLSSIYGLKADEKLYLIFILFTTEQVATPGRFSLIESNGEQLGKRFGFTKTASFRALHKLKQLGMINELTHQGRVGRPRKLREVISRSWETERTNQNIFKAALSRQCFNLISNRLKHPQLFEQTGRSNTLFLLLLVLTGKADGSGVISTVSQTTLSSYTGIPHRQIQRRIHQLQKLDIISDLIPGLVEGSFLGKPNSIYFLNFRHPIFENTGVFVDPIEIQGKGCTTTEVDQLAMKLGHPGLHDRLASAAQHAATPPGIKRTRISPGSWEQNAPDLLRRPAAKLYTQCVIERYAAKLLSHPSSILSGSEWRRAQDHATEDFVQELNGERPTAVKKSGEYSRMFYSLCADLEELSHQLASLCIGVGKLPKRASTMSTPITTYRILPSGTGKRSEIRLERITLRT